MKQSASPVSWTAVSVGILGLVFGYTLALSMHETSAFAGAVKCPYHHMDIQPS